MPNPITLNDAIAELRQSAKFRAWNKLAVSDLANLAQSAAEERHYSPLEISKLWGVSVQTVRDVFRNEEGVLKIGSNGTRTRRGYKTLRIPHSVVERVHTRLSA